jgi:hypothetical protein
MRNILNQLVGRHKNGKITDQKSSFLENNHFFGFSDGHELCEVFVD